MTIWFDKKAIRQYFSTLSRRLKTALWLVQSEFRQLICRHYKRQLIMQRDLKQFYFCHDCYDFYNEKAISINFKSYLTAELSNNLGNCPIGHERSIDKEDIIYLPSKPDKITSSPVLCFDIEGFSKKDQIAQFNNLSILHAACLEIFSTENNTDLIYKGTGDGFIIGFPNRTISDVIDFCENLIDQYLKHVDFFTYRIGIDYGSYFKYLDLHNQNDLLGKKITNVTRIADFGRNNNVLLSEDAAENFSNDNRGNNLTKLGFCFDKHRIPHKVFNYHSKKIGSGFE